MYTCVHAHTYTSEVCYVWEIEEVHTAFVIYIHVCLNTEFSVSLISVSFSLNMNQ